MKRRAQDINEHSTWQDMTVGAEIFEPATSLLVNAGDWVKVCPFGAIDFVKEVK